MNNKLVIRILIAVVFLGASAFIVFNENGLLKFLKIRKELKQMDSEIKKAEEKLFMLEREIDSLKTSKVKLERVAREKYHMLKKTEKVFRIEEK
ncbi:MAG: septum formation initiator family protein [Melioribacteraceae bacterium]